MHFSQLRTFYLLEKLLFVKGRQKREREREKKKYCIVVFISHQPTSSRAQQSVESQRPRDTPRHSLLVLTTLHFPRYIGMSRNSLTPLLCLCTSGIQHLLHRGTVVANHKGSRSLTICLFLHQEIWNELFGRRRRSRRRRKVGIRGVGGGGW